LELRWEQDWELHFIMENWQLMKTLWDSPFKDSICEDYLATRWFVNRYEELTGEQISGTKDLLDKPAKYRNRYLMNMQILF
jgi:glucokinase